MQHPARRRLLLAAAFFALPTAISTDCRRQVYLDLGANWANTLRLHHKLQNSIRRTTRFPVDPSPFNNCSYEWEVYSFEASPVIHPFVDAFVKFLNGKGPKPPITIPPIGGSIQMLSYARHFGCPSRHNRSEYASMYACMNEIFKEPYAALKVDAALNESALVESRLAEAATPNRDAKTRFTFVPAAVGATAGSLHLQWPAGVMTSVRMEDNTVPRPVGVPEHMYVQKVDFVQWLTRHFSANDIVVAKMDIEGEEHAILPRMTKDKSIDLIDVLGLECHASGGRRIERGKTRCASLIDDLTKHGVRLVSEASYSPLSSGVDQFSHAKDMMPADPRGIVSRDPKALTKVLTTSLAASLIN